MKFSRITHRNKIANKIAKWFRLREIKKDLKVSVYFKLDRAVFQKNKDYKPQDNSRCKKAQESSTPAPSRSSCEMRQITQGFILSGLEDLKDRDLTDSANSLSPCLPDHTGRKLLMASTAPLAALVPKATSSPALVVQSLVGGQLLQLPTTSVVLCWTSFFYIKNLRCLIKVDSTSLNVLKALGRACITKRNNCKFFLKKTFRDEEWNLYFF